jgi:hypothetical protein
LPPSAQVREFLQGKLSSLRKPKTNISIIQQNVLLKYKYFVRFLEAHGPDVHQEVRSAAGFLPGFGTTALIREMPTTCLTACGVTYFTHDVLH